MAWHSCTSSQCHTRCLGARTGWYIRVFVRLAWRSIRYSIRYSFDSGNERNQQIFGITGIGIFVTSARKTRSSRVAAGKCVVCLRRSAVDGPTCRVCRKQIATASAKRYAERISGGKCYWCGGKASGYLCDAHADQRNARRRELSEAKRP